jgi:hypothetical protein
METSTLFPRRRRSIDPPATDDLHLPPSVPLSRCTMPMQLQHQHQHGNKRNDGIIPTSVIASYQRHHVSPRYPPKFIIFVIILFFFTTLPLLVLILPNLFDINTSHNTLYHRYLTLQDYSNGENYLTFQGVKTFTADNNVVVDKEKEEDKCSQILLYFDNEYADHGHGSQINTYILSILLGTYLNRRVVLLSPPKHTDTIYHGGSPFGCPADAFATSTDANYYFSESSATATTTPTFQHDFPNGLSRLIDHPNWLSGGCPIPCKDTHTYDDWVQIVVNQRKLSRKKSLDSSRISCHERDGRQVDVIIAGGDMVRQSIQKYKDGFVPSEEWARRLGGTVEETRVFSKLSSNEDVMWDYICGILNRVGIPRFQPWIGRDVQAFIDSLDLFQDNGSDVVYDAIHVRRGDKLILEQRPLIESYWKSQGYTDTTNLPQDYVPFSQYLTRFDKSECPVNELGEVIDQKRHVVYVATDDRNVVQDEIASLPNHIDDDWNRVVWNDCHDLTFFITPPANGDGVYHLNGGHEEERMIRGRMKRVWISDRSQDDCHKRYRRSIASFADMMILSRSRTLM